MTILDTILRDKRLHVEQQRHNVKESELRTQIKQITAPRGFHRALSEKKLAQKTGLIAEVKKASPSKGVIRKDFDPVAHAKAYAAAGATCLSVLTDVPFFHGKDVYLTEIRNAVSLPLLRKDFMIDPYQILESRALGADCVLLILSALDDVQAHELESAALELGMDVLIEVHDEAEMQRALDMKSTLIGINNRNLKDFSVSLGTAIRLSSMAAPEHLLVAESGISVPKDVEILAFSGIYAILVGESLMREPDIEAATRRLLGV